jgi:hypothetical protein
MTRAEHLAWAKARALEYANRGDAAGAVASMASDLGKHPELASHIGITLGAMQLFAGQLSGHQLREWIEGFN